MQSLNGDVPHRYAASTLKKILVLAATLTSVSMATGTPSKATFAVSSPYQSPLSRPTSMPVPQSSAMVEGWTASVTAIGTAASALILGIAGVFAKKQLEEARRLREAQTRPAMRGQRIILDPGPREAVAPV